MPTCFREIPKLMPKSCLAGALPVKALSRAGPRRTTWCDWWPMRCLSAHYSTVTYLSFEKTQHIILICAKFVSILTFIRVLLYTETNSHLCTYLFDSSASWRANIVRRRCTADKDNYSQPTYIFMHIWCRSRRSWKHHRKLNVLWNICFYLHEDEVMTLNQRA